MTPCIQVFGQRELVAHLRQGLPVGSHLISVGNPKPFGRPPQEDETMPREFHRAFHAILRLGFYDLPSTDLVPPGKPKRIPELRDIARVRRFYDQTKATATGYTVHSWAGVSRSAAVDLGLAFLITGDEETAARELVSVRKEAAPHPGIVALWDQLLGSHLAETNQTIRTERMREIRREILRVVTAQQEQTVRNLGVEVEDL